MAIAKLHVRNVKPNFTHDCNACRFLGSLNGEDMYVCHNYNISSLIFRMSSEPSDYGSMGINTIPYLPAGNKYKLAAILAKKDAIGMLHETCGYLTR